MNLYLLTRADYFGYEEYDSCVVVSSTTEKACKIHPGLSKEKQGSSYYLDSWTSPDNIVVTYLGLAAPALKEGLVICASFNAG